MHRSVKGAIRRRTWRATKSSTRGRYASRTRRVGFPSPHTSASAPIRPHHAVPSTCFRGGTGSRSQVRCFRSSPTRTPPPMARSRRMPATEFWQAHGASPSHRVTSKPIPPLELERVARLLAAGFSVRPGRHSTGTPRVWTAGIPKRPQSESASPL
jgi:hypothetical protein